MSDDRMILFTDRTRALFPMPALIPMSDTRPPEFCARCGHQVVPLTLACGWGRDAEGRALCHPNEPGHEDCYTLETQTFGLAVAIRDSLGRDPAAADVATGRDVGAEGAR